MPNPASTLVGVVEELWRYPVKSMIGEQLTATEVTESGLLGDRAYALRDTSDGKIATAKNPRKWPNLFDYAAALTAAATTGEKLPPARIMLPDATTISTEQPDADRILSAALKREVRLERIARNRRDVAASNKETSEEYWLDMEGAPGHGYRLQPAGGYFFRHGNRPHPDHRRAPTLARTVSRGAFRSAQVPAERGSEPDGRLQRLC
jgi:hypothetical protein